MKLNFLDSKGRYLSLRKTSAYVCASVGFRYAEWYFWNMPSGPKKRSVECKLQLTPENYSLKIQTEFHSKYRKLNIKFEQPLMNCATVNQWLLTFE